MHREEQTGIGSREPISDPSPVAVGEGGTGPTQGFPTDDTRVTGVGVPVGGRGPGRLHGAGGASDATEPEPAGEGTVNGIGTSHVGGQGATASGGGSRDERGASPV
jgi:hypothetical protein